MHCIIEKCTMHDITISFLREPLTTRSSLPVNFTRKAQLFYTLVIVINFDFALTLV